MKQKPINPKHDIQSKLKVYVQKRTKKIHSPNKFQFQQWAQTALISPTNASEVTIRIVNATESARLNETYRHKNGPTNVLSFNYSNVPGEPTALLGDLVICAELVQQEAETEKKLLLAHWAHLTVHGMLHLQGYDHVETTSAAQMEQLEIKILKKLGFANPYHDVAAD